LPYVGPYVLFLVLVQVEGWIPDLAGPLLPLKVVLPAGWVAACAWRGDYPELRIRRGGVAGWLADVGRKVTVSKKGL
jgi:hypothetical protein